MWKMVHKLPGKAEMEMRNEFKKTWLSGDDLP
jgi:hypothetical protein